MEYKNPKTGETIESDMSLAEAITILQTGTNRSRFSDSLVNQFKMGRVLSSAQIFWVMKLAAPVEEKEADKAETTYEGFARAVMFLKNCNLKRPKVTLSASGTTVRFRRYEKEPYTGGVIVDTNDGQWKPFAFITSSGTLTRTSHCTDEIFGLIEAFNADPVQAVQRFAALTGQCSFCRLPLTDERSVSVGYGNICARNYHLPWGDSEVYLARAEMQKKLEELAVAEIERLKNELMGNAASL